MEAERVGEALFATRERGQGRIRVMQEQGQNGQFPATDWDEIRAAGDLCSVAGREAMNRFLERYRRPLLTHLMGKFALKPCEAEDLLHGFIHEKVMVESLLSRADASRGRFRGFILNALDNYVLTCLRRQRSLKRNPLGCVPIQEVSEMDLPQHHDPPAGVEIVWARAVIAGALLNMRAELERRGRLDIWSVFEHRVLLPRLDDQPPLNYDELIRRFGFKSPSEAFNVLVTAKRMFQRHLTSVIAEYASTDSEVESELADLRAKLSRMPAETNSGRSRRPAKPRGRVRAFGRQAAGRAGSNRRSANHGGLTACRDDVERWDAPGASAAARRLCTEEEKELSAVAQFFSDPPQDPNSECV
jgi:hypothetical protein